MKLENQIMKKAQGLSVQTIIIAIIVLVVLVVLVAVFTGFFGGFNTDVNSCSTIGGECVGTESACTGEGGTLRSAGHGDCEARLGPGSVCCGGLL